MTDLSRLLAKEQENLQYFFENISPSAIEEVFELMKKCKGLLIWSGIGKSGLVAKKIAATMTSVSVRALYLSPVNALHGDIGVVGNQDIFFFLSKSGESEELLHLVPALKNKGVKMVAVVCKKDSRLAKACDYVIDLPLKEELCPFGMAPTTSTTIQMLFGDLLTVALMEESNFSLDEYALNHPAGRIGKAITVKVKDLMIRGDALPLCSPESLLIDMLVELSNKRCGCILVHENRKLKGIFTDGDLRRHLQLSGPKSLQEPLSSLMTKNPRVTFPEMMAAKALKLMEGLGKGEVSVLPVIGEDNEILGLIKLHDIIQSGI